MKEVSIIPEFVEQIPDVLAEGVIYISEKYGISAHNCCCGCGERTVMGFKPHWEDAWELRINGNLVSFSPSVGNQQFNCQSHYVITNNVATFVD